MNTMPLCTLQDPKPKRVAADSCQQSGHGGIEIRLLGTCLRQKQLVVCEAGDASNVDFFGGTP